MGVKEKNSIFSNVGGDLAAGLVVFFVAVPLCLGIALASGAPLFSGIVAGIVGGIVIGSISKSQLSVSGPAAGLTAIILVAITDLGAFEIFLCAGIVAGLVQLVLGLVKAGTIANYFPSNVIEGMLAGIGLIIILKQIPHAIGYDKDYEGSESFADLFGNLGDNTFTVLGQSFNYITPGAVVVALVGIAIMLTWEKVNALKKIKILPGPLVAVIAGVILNEIFARGNSFLAIPSSHLVNLPIITDFSSFISQFRQPNLNGFFDSRVWVYGFTIAIVASIETLLCIEATDRLDPQKRYTPGNRELQAQGIGNIVSSLLGGLPMTSVIVRSSANVNAGAKTKLSTISHGVLILVSAATIPFLLNKIPLAVLASILLITGYKLTKPALYKKMWRSGLYQFIPFIVTIVAIVMTDLLKGVALGMIISVFLILRENLKSPYFFKRTEHRSGDIVHIKLAQEVSFLNKAAIKQTLEHLPENGYVIIDATETVFIDHDVLELIKEFKEVKVKERGIRLELAGFLAEYELENTLQNQHVYSEPEETDDIDDSIEPVSVSSRHYKELIVKLKGNKEAMES